MPYRNSQVVSNSNDFFTLKTEMISSKNERFALKLKGYGTSLPSSVCVVGCAFIMAVSVYQISKTNAEI